MISEVNYEKSLIINNRQLKYNGLFRADELFSTLNRVIEERGYEKREKKSEEIVAEEGRRSYVELRPYKVITNYLTLMIKIKVNLDKVTEKLETARGEKKKYQQGELLIAFDAWVLTDYKDRWGMKPGFYFLKSLVNKFVYKTPIEAGVQGILVADTAYIYARIKKMLDSYRPGEERPKKEEEIRKEVEEELNKEIEAEAKFLSDNFSE